MRPWVGRCSAVLSDKRNFRVVGVKSRVRAVCMAELCQKLEVFDENRLVFSSILARYSCINGRYAQTPLWHCC